MPELVRRPGPGARLARLWQLAIVMALALAFALPTLSIDSAKIADAQDTPSTDAGPRWNADAADYDPTTTPSNLQELQQLEQIVIDAVEAVRPAVVGLLIEGQAGGSGAFVSADGWIAGCRHVNGEPNRNCKVFLADGTTVDGVTMGQNAQLDLALVKADLGDRTVPYVSFGSAADVKVGEWLLSMGHPMGREAGRGPVVRLGRVFSNGQMISLDAPLISGDSGGPTFTLTGKIVGINNSIMPNDHRRNNLARSDFLRDNYEAMKDPSFTPGGDSTDTMPLGQYERLLTEAAVLLDQGKWHDADDKILEALALNPDDPQGYYMHARLHGLRSASDEAEDNDVAMVYDQLGKAVDRGFGNIGQLERDRAFMHLHDNDAWAKLIKKIEDSGNAPPRQRAFLGVNIQEQVGEVVITAITPGSAAEHAGLLAGDVFVKFAGRDISTTADLRDAVLSLTPGEEAIVVVRRNDEEMQFIVLLGARADDPTVPDNPGGGEMLEGRMWKDGEVMRSLTSAVATPLSKAVVRVRAGNRIVALGTIVRSDGYILTKLSEVKDSNNVRVQLPNGRLVAAQIVNEDETLDLALLKVAARQLDVVKFAKTESEHTIGQFVLSVNHQERALSWGVISLESYVTRSEADRPFLGVGVGDPVTTEDLEGTGHAAGCRFGEITPGSGAEAAGLEAGDICVAIDGEPTPEFQVLAEIIGRHAPGDEIKMTIVRGGEVLDLTATLGRRGQPAQPEQPNNPFPFPLPGLNGGVEGPVSSVRSGFGSVIQHDGNVQPDSVGGPLVTLNGDVVGLNIARGDRTKTYAIPGAALVELVPTMIKTARKVTGPDEDDEEEDF